MKCRNWKKKKISRKLYLLCFMIISISFLTCCSHLEKKKETEEVPKGMYTSKQIELDNVYLKKMTSDDKYIYLLASKDQRNGSKADKIFVIKAGSDKKEENEKKVIELMDFPIGEILCFQKMKEGYRIFLKESRGNSIIIVLDEEGAIKEILQLDLKEEVENRETMTFFGSVFDQNGGLYFSDYNGNLYYIKEDGILDKKINTDMGIYPDTMILTEDQKLFCSHYCPEKEQYISWFDIKEFATISEGKEIKQKKAVMPFSSMKSNYYLIPCIDKTYDFYIYNLLDLYGYSMEEKKQEVILNWTNSDITGNYITQAIEVNGYIFVLFQDGYKDNNSLLFYELHKTTEKEYKSREILTVGTLNSYSLGQKILEYNRRQSKVRLIIRDYNNREDPYQALHNDIISGQTPDILDTNRLNIENYIKKGIVQDLTDFINQDSEISEEDFLDNIVAISKVNGKLYYLPSAFSIMIYAGSNDILKDKKTWTIKEFMDIYKGEKKELALFGFDTKESVFDFLCNSILDEFIEKETQKVNFKTKIFTNILKFSKNYKESGIDDISKRVEGLQNGTILLEYGSFYDFSFYFYAKAIFGDTTFIGTPSEQGTGIKAIIESPLLVITTASQKKELSFEFLKSFWTYQYQKENIKYSFPSRKDALAMKFEYASAEKAYTDKDGQEVQAVNETINLNGVNARIMPLTKKEVNQFQEIIERIDTFWLENSVEMDVYNIIKEEVQAYFQGDKNEKQTEEVIQNRVKLYLSENE